MTADPCTLARTRRSFLGALALGAETMFGRAFQSSEAPGGPAVSISIHSKNHIASVPSDYNGLSYESAQLAHPEFFSPANKNLIAFFRRLAKQGVLRTGGNTSEFTIWSPTGVPASPPEESAVGPDGGGPRRRRTGPRPRTPITPEAIRNLTAFLDATGWQLIYGLNLGKGTPEQAAQEAKAVNDIVGRRLIAFQIGNEPDLFHRNRPWDLRPAGWNFDSYFAQWQDFHKAVREAVPNASFGAPDVANLEATDWVIEFAEKAANEVVLLSGHYYAEGPPEDPRMTISRLLQRDPRLLAKTPQIMEASRKAHRPFRMTEGNSCFNGGKRDVSDTFASALWAGDYMLFLAQSGYSGVNFHGGGNGIYTPIAGSINAGFLARPMYYGMLVGEEFAGATMVETQVDAGTANVTAYGAKKNSEIRAAIFNKDERQAIQATLKLDTRAHHAKLWRLTGPSLESKTGVRLAGAEVSPDGTWAPLQEENVSRIHGQFRVDVPAAGAVLVFLS